jgi:hypothetical protein
MPPIVEVPPGTEGPHVIPPEVVRCLAPIVPPSVRDVFQLAARHGNGVDLRTGQVRAIAVWLEAELGAERRRRE